MTSGGPWSEFLVVKGRMADVTIARLLDRFLAHKEKRNNYCLPTEADFIFQRWLSCMFFYNETLLLSH